MSVSRPELPSISDGDGIVVDNSGSKNSTVLYAGAILTGMTSASFVFNFVLIVVLVVKKRFVTKFKIIVPASQLLVSGQCLI